MRVTPLLFLCTMRVWLCLWLLAALSLHTAQAEFGCGDEKYTGDWQHNPARGLLAAGFAVLVFSLLMLCVASWTGPGADGFSPVSGQAPPPLQWWGGLSVVFAALVIAGTTHLEGYDHRETMGARLTVAMLCSAAALHMAGAVAAVAAYSDEVHNKTLAWFSGICLLAAWTMFPVTLNFDQKSEFHLMAWFGFAGLAQAAVPYMFFKHHFTGATGGGEAFTAGTGIFSLFSLVGVVLTAVVIQRGPCYHHYPE
jgi:hypothetical protein